MIVPNLTVRDIANYVRFYRETLGMKMTMAVSPTREVGWPGEPDRAAFAMLEWDGSQLLLQTVASMAEELPLFESEHAPRCPAPSTSATCTPILCVIASPPRKSSRDPDRVGTVRTKSASGIRMDTSSASVRPTRPRRSEWPLPDARPSHQRMLSIRSSPATRSRRCEGTRERLPNR